MTGAKLTIVLPMLNEAENAEWVIEELFSALSEHQLDVVAVNDGSADDTQHVLDGLTERFPRLRARAHEQRSGYGAAIRTGLAIAETRFVGWMDGDGQYDPADFLVFLDALEAGAVAAIGVRTERADAAHRRFLGKAGTRLASAISGIELRDADAGIKLFDTACVDLAGMTAMGSYISTDALKRAKRVGPIEQIDVTHRERQAGQQTGASLWVLIRLVGDFIRCETPIITDKIRALRRR